jgi:hypothetical protein
MFQKIIGQRGQSCPVVASTSGRSHPLLVAVAFPFLAPGYRLDSRVFAERTAAQQV